MKTTAELSLSQSPSFSILITDDRQLHSHRRLSTRLVSESYINVELQRCTRVIGDGPRDLELWSSDEDDA
ncbi:hypothetical protein TNCV_2077251 [Trichonephila clavipes]|nr:hypothetical protein TNCV_2077251 [Trichonephila clavipes]